MSATDIIKKSVLEYFSTNDMSPATILISIAAAFLLGLYIGVVYYFNTKKTFWQKSFNISLIALVIITEGVILAMQSNLVISLGMVGALSIVRFRTAIKDAMDLIFLFWAISVGVICGAGLFWLALVVSIAVTIIIIGCDCLSIGTVSKVLVVNLEEPDCEESIMKNIKKYAKGVEVKSRNMNGVNYCMTMECKTKTDNELIRVLSKMKGVKSVALFVHNGEAVF